MEPILMKSKKTNRINTGRATNELIFSAYQANNDEVFPFILDLYVAPGARIADVTYGQGVFWKKIDISKYELYPSDLKNTNLPQGCEGNIDSRSLPYEDSSFDVIVFDPPYMHTPGGTAHNGHQNFERYYANNSEYEKNFLKRIIQKGNGNVPKYHEAVLDLYFRTGKESWRVLKENGIFIVKCQDEVCANKQRLTHVEITVEYQNYGFVIDDLFVIMRKNKPGISRLKTKQFHARKNHSYFMIYKKPKKSIIMQSKDTPIQRRTQRKVL